MKQSRREFMTAQIAELLTNYGAIAAIWLDGIATPLSGDRKKFRCQELYALIHRLQPQVLVSYKQGLLGAEDFFAPEHKVLQEMGKRISAEGFPSGPVTTGNAEPRKKKK